MNRALYNHFISLLSPVFHISDYTAAIFLCFYTRLYNYIRTQSWQPEFNSILLILLATFRDMGKLGTLKIMGQTYQWCKLFYKYGVWDKCNIYKGPVPCFPTHTPMCWEKCPGLQSKGVREGLME